MVYNTFNLFLINVYNFVNTVRDNMYQIKAIKYSE